MSFDLKYREISKLLQQNKSSKTTLSTRRKSHNKRSETQTPAKSKNDTWWISKYEWCTPSQDTTNQNTVFTIYKFWLDNCGAWTLLLYWKVLWHDFVPTSIRGNVFITV